MLPQGFCLPKRSAEKLRGSYAIGGLVAAGMNGSDFANAAGMGLGLGNMVAGSAGTVLACTEWTGAGLVGTQVAGMGSLGALVTGVCARGAIGATSPFDEVTVGLGTVQTGCGGVTVLSSMQVAGMGLAMGDGGLLDLLGHPFALGLMSEAGGRDSFALGAVSPVIWLVVGSRSWIAGVVGRKSVTLGTGPINVSVSIAQSNRCGSSAVAKGAG